MYRQSFLTVWRPSSQSIDRSSSRATVYSAVSARTVKRTNTSTALFEPPARHIDTRSVQLGDFAELNNIRPILSRLPRAEWENDTSTPSSPQAVAPNETYLTLEKHPDLPGTFRGSRQDVLYTASRLPEIDSASFHLWQALHNIRALTADYAGDFATAAATQSGQCPFSKSKSSQRSALTLVRNVFNWHELSLPPAVSGTFFGVVFRSKRRAGSESTNLYHADKLSHEEAVTSGGLLMYWYGIPDPATGNNLASCIWTDREAARRASRLPFHREAAEHAKWAYREFELSRYAVVKKKGESKVRVEEWKD